MDRGAYFQQISYEHVQKEGTLKEGGFLMSRMKSLETIRHLHTNLTFALPTVRLIHPLVPFVI